MSKTYDPIATTTLASNQASVTFNSLAGYTDLFIVSFFRATSAGGNFKIEFNGDTGTNYSDTSIYGNGSTAFSGRGTNRNAIIIGQSDSTQYLTNLCNVMNYANSTTNKTTLSRSSDNGNLYSSAGAIVGLWRSTAAITSIKLYADGNLQSGSVFTVYGIKAE